MSKGEIITIPKKLAKEGELVIMPRDEYEEYLLLKKAILIGKLSKSEKKAIGEGRQEIKKGESFTLKQLRVFLEG